MTTGLKPSEYLPIIRWDAANVPRPDRGATRHRKGRGASEQFVLVLEPLPYWSTPAITRLRKFLKSALRQHGLRAVHVAEHVAAGQPGGEPMGNGALQDELATSGALAADRVQRKAVL